MNRKPWITTLTSAVVVSVALTGTPALADHAYAVSKGHANQGVYAYARVISAEPIVRRSEVTPATGRRAIPTCRECRPFRKWQSPQP